jgi:hypothetical protein
VREGGDEFALSAEDVAAGCALVCLGNDHRQRRGDASTEVVAVIRARTSRRTFIISVIYRNAILAYIFPAIRSSHSTIRYQ